MQQNEIYVYAGWDEAFCGIWSGGGNSVTINPASPEVGGFYIYFYINGNVATAFAYGDEMGGLVVHHGESETDGGEFLGYLEQSDGVLSFYVQTTGTDLFNEGESYIFQK